MVLGIDAMVVWSSGNLFRIERAFENQIAGFFLREDPGLVGGSRKFSVAVLGDRVHGGVPGDRGAADRNSSSSMGGS